MKTKTTPTPRAADDRHVWTCPRCGHESKAPTFGVAPQRVDELLAMNHERKCPQGASS